VVSIFSDTEVGMALLPRAGRGDSRNASVVAALF
jgi:hypothetical protein